MSHHNVEHFFGCECSIPAMLREAMKFNHPTLLIQTGQEPVITSPEFCGSLVLYMPPISAGALTDLIKNFFSTDRTALLLESGELEFVDDFESAGKDGRFKFKAHAVNGLVQSVICTRCWKPADIQKQTE